MVDFQVISTTDALSGSHACQHNFSALLLMRRVHSLNHSWFYSNLPVGILYSLL